MKCLHVELCSQSTITFTEITQKRQIKYYLKNNILFKYLWGTHDQLLHFLRRSLNMFNLSTDFKSEIFQIYVPKLSKLLVLKGLYLFTGIFKFRSYFFLQAWNIILVINIQESIILCFFKASGNYF